MRAVVIAGAARTPMGGFQPALSSMTSPPCHDQAPFPTAALPAAGAPLDRLRWSVASVDPSATGEAFAVVLKVSMRPPGVPRERMKINGDACVLGHPIGASGTPVPPLQAQKACDLKKCIAAICIDGGKGIAAAPERP